MIYFIQQCQKCNIPVYPYKQQKLEQTKEGENKSDPNKEHPMVCIFDDSLPILILIRL